VEHRATYRVRFDEAGPDGLARTSTILRYTQDLAGLHSEARGYDRAWYTERGLTWLVRTAVVAVEAAIPYGVDLEASTRAVAFRRVWARRRSEFRLPDGARAALVDIDWLLIDGRGSPARIPPEFDAAFGAPSTSEPITRVDPPATPDDAVRRRFTVRPHELDPMSHANNATYADWLDEAFGAAFGPGLAGAVPRTVAIEYATAAAPGAALESAAWADGADRWYRLRAVDGPEIARGRLGPGDPGAAPLRQAGVT
jgi:acyl-ACP thioesterase